MRESKAHICLEERDGDVPLRAVALTCSQCEERGRSVVDRKRNRQRTVNLLKRTIHRKRIPYDRETKCKVNRPEKTLLFIVPGKVTCIVDPVTLVPVEVAKYGIPVGYFTFRLRVQPLEYLTMAS